MQDAIDLLTNGESLARCARFIRKRRHRPASDGWVGSESVRRAGVGELAKRLGAEVDSIVHTQDVKSPVLYWSKLKWVLMRCICVWSVGFMTVCLSLKAASRIEYIGLPETRMKLLSQGSADFDAILASRVDRQSLERIGPILPFSVILVNEASSPVIAVVVRAELLNAAGKTNHATVTLVTMNKRRMFAPGSVMFLTPVGGLSTELRRDTPNTISDANYEQLERAIKHRSDMFQGRESVRISLDSVVFGDGGVVGPDEAKTLERMNAWLQAERGVLEELQRCQPAEIRVFLDQVKSTPHNTNGSARAEFATQRVRTADMALMWVEQVGTGSNFAAMVADRLASLIPLLHRRTM
jgi:hypothetical protein